MLDLLWRARFRWKLHPRQTTGDTTYGTIENITALEREGIRAYLPLPDYEQRTPYLANASFATILNATSTSVLKGRASDQLGSPKWIVPSATKRLPPRAALAHNGRSVRPIPGGVW